MNAFTTEVYISGKLKQMRVEYEIRDLSPELKPNCTCLDDGIIYPVDNWEEQFVKEAGMDMVAKGSMNELEGV